MICLYRKGGTPGTYSITIVSHLQIALFCGIILKTEHVENSPNDIEVMILATHDEFVELVDMTMINKNELSQLAHVDPRRLSDILSGEHNYKHYENTICRILAVRARAILRQLDEYGHGDK